MFPLGQSNSTPPARTLGQRSEIRLRAAAGFSLIELLLVVGLVLLLAGPVCFLLAISVIGIAVIPFLLCALLIAAIVGRVGFARWIGMSVLRESDPSSRAQTLGSLPTRDDDLPRLAVAPRRCPLRQRQDAPHSVVGHRLRPKHPGAVAGVDDLFEVHRSST